MPELHDQHPLMPLLQMNLFCRFVHAAKHISSFTHLLFHAVSFLSVRPHAIAFYLFCINWTM